MEKSAEEAIQKYIQIIIDRSVPDGGFSQKENGIFRPDTSAWAILALSGKQPHSLMIEGACRRISANQLPDGRVVLMEGLDSAWWPTPLAVLAWNKSFRFEKEIGRAIAFLLGASGLHSPKPKDSPVGHDTSIPGWSWVENTASWIEPTSIAVLALRVTGHSDHQRVSEAVRMILDRQLPSGGWNYGNTTVFQKELLPMPDHTGEALCALAGMVQRSQIQKSIDYATNQLDSLTSPLSLCWCLFGLRAWSVEVADIRKRVLNSLALQEKFGKYNTTLISKLIITYINDGDLLSFLGIG